MKSTFTKYPWLPLAIIGMVLAIVAVLLSVATFVVTGCDPLKIVCQNYSPAPASAAQLQKIHCAREGKVWDEVSHSCLTAEESLRRAEEKWKAEKARVEIEYGFSYIPGVAAFRPGDHFWVSPTEAFTNLHEYEVGEDGSILDLTGVAAPADTLRDGRRDVIGSDGRPFFSAEVRIINGEVWTWWNVVSGRAGWVKR